MRFVCVFGKPRPKPKKCHDFFDYFLKSHFSETPMATFSGNLPGAVPSYDGIKAPAHATINDETVKKIKKSKKIVRTGGGQMWEDPSLKEWDVNDFRIFCGDLGNDVTDEVLQRTFGRYPSFQKAKVIRDKKSNKTKGKKKKTCSSIFE